MKQRIMNNVCFLVVLSVLISFLAASVVMYQKNSGAMRQDVKNEAEYLWYAVENMGEDYLDAEVGRLTTSRITLTSAQGELLFDSDEGNYLEPDYTDSPDMRTAAEKGIGEYMSFSNALSEQTFYFSTSSSSRICSAYA